MIYHFVPFDMWYWNLILHQYKWCIATRCRGCGWQRDLWIRLYVFVPPFSFQIYIVLKHKGFEPTSSPLWYACFKKKTSLRASLLLAKGLVAKGKHQKSTGSVTAHLDIICVPREIHDTQLTFFCCTWSLFHGQLSHSHTPYLTRCSDA